MIDYVDQMANALIELRRYKEIYYQAISKRNNPDFDADRCYKDYLNYQEAKRNFKHIEPLFNEYIQIHREGIQICDEEEYGVC